MYNYAWWLIENFLILYGVNSFGKCLFYEELYLGCSYRELVCSDTVKITQLKCPCCLVTLLKRHRSMEPQHNAIPEHGYVSAHNTVVSDLYPCIHALVGVGTNQYASMTNFSCFSKFRKWPTRNKNMLFKQDFRGGGYWFTWDGTRSNLQ